ncbi:hypothetical protein RR48_10527 [Papilio machaon]|uniref:Uncharacterized protein n=1 Tax=Papilio machaon TaxID=76193 RepID=A0A194R5E3_PAPMA|nr:hypothetical protein RR48_10527 [Papilio machaon]
MLRGRVLYAGTGNECMRVSRGRAKCARRVPSRCARENCVRCACTAATEPPTGAGSGARRSLAPPLPPLS